MNKYSLIQLNFRKDEVISVTYSYTVKTKTRTFTFDLLCKQSHESINLQLLTDSLNRSLVLPFLPFLHTSVRFNRLSILKDPSSLNLNQRRTLDKSGRELHTVLCTHEMVGQKYHPTIPDTALQVELLSNSSRHTSKRYMFGAVPTVLDAVYYEVGGQASNLNVINSTGASLNAEIIKSAERIESVYIQPITVNEKLTLENVVLKKRENIISYEPILSCKFRGTTKISKPAVKVTAKVATKAKGKK